VLCGLAPNLELLVLARILQGAAGALLVPGALSIITSTFEGPERGRAFGVWAAATSATTTLGPLLGGFLVDAFSWRIVFLINVPLVIIAAYATLRHVAETRDEKATGHFDWLGAVVVVLAVGGLSFGAIRGEATRWTDPIAFVALGVGAVAMITFPFLMSRRRDPLVPLSLFRSRNFSVANLTTFVVYGGLYVSFAFVGLFLQSTLGYTAFAAGASGVPVGIMLALFSTTVGGIAGRIGARWFMAVGPAIMGVGVLWLARIPSSSTPWQASLSDAATLAPSAGYLTDVLPGFLLFGLGLTLLVAPLTSAVMGSVPVRNAGLASAINNAISRVGAPLVSAVIFIAITASFYAAMEQRVPGLDTASPELRAAIQPLNRPEAGVPEEQVAAAREASTDAFHLAMLVSAGLLFAGAAISGLGIRDRSREGGAVQPTAEEVPAAGAG
jgi:EmrB/QacA subfamily drug resistance transporter